MDNLSPEALKLARVPIASLISKSEKAQQKLTPGTWQHRMLQENLDALRVASGLMDSTDAVAKVSSGDLEKSLRVLPSIIQKTEKTETKFAPGTSQHSLQRNRLSALRAAEALIKAALARTHKKAQL